MKSLTLLIYGTNIPPHKHLHKLGNKFINQFIKVRETENFNDDEFYEVIVEEESLNRETRNYKHAPVIPVHKNYLHNLLKVYGNINATVTLCSQQHEHPIVYFNEIEYEGYCYYELSTDHKILFFKVFDTKYVVSLPKKDCAEKLMINTIQHHFESAF